MARSAVKVESNASIDLSRRLGSVSWTPSAATLLAEGEAGRVLWAQTLNRGALSVAGQLLGLAQRMLDLSVDYVAQRKQFGKPIGSFQAVKHHLASAQVAIEFARPVVLAAAASVGQQDIFSRARASHAKIVALEAEF